MKIKMFDAREDEVEVAQRWAKENQVEVETTSSHLTIDEAKGLKGIDGVSIAQDGYLKDEVYDILSKKGIKQISQRSTGVDAYDLNLAKEKGLIITNVPGYSPESIAEFTVMSALNFIRKTKEIEKRTAGHNFSFEHQVMGRVLGNMTVAVLGTGGIGSIVAKLFKAFGCKVVAYNRSIKEELKDVVEFKETAKEAVKNADIITIHMPATEGNYHMFDREFFKNMENKPLILNMARGSIVDTKALIEAIDEGIVTGAALDTYENEEVYMGVDWSNKEIEDELLLEILSKDEINVTPHIAFYTDEAIKNIVEINLTSIKNIIETGDDKYRVN